MDDKPFEVESPTRIRVGPEVRFWAEQSGMTINEMAKHLLHQHYHGDQVSEEIEI